jgi:hypothetical protein
MSSPEENKKIIDNHLKSKLFLIESQMIDKNNWKFLVQSFSGNNYYVQISDKLECSCSLEKVCKHIIFIITKVLKCSEPGLENIHIFLFKLNLKDDKFNSNTNPRYKRNCEENDDEVNNEGDGSDCPICYEQLCVKVTKCEQCRHIFHNECITRWKRTCTTCNCPICRGNLN